MWKALLYDKSLHSFHSCVAPSHLLQDLTCGLCCSPNKDACLQNSGRERGLRKCPSNNVNYQLNNELMTVQMLVVSNPLSSILSFHSVKSDLQNFGIRKMIFKCLKKFKLLLCIFLKKNTNFVEGVKRNNGPMREGISTFSIKSELGE